MNKTCVKYLGIIKQKYGYESDIIMSALLY